jgi:hypothetical protein
MHYDGCPSRVLGELAAAMGASAVWLSAVLMAGVARPARQVQLRDKEQLSRHGQLHCSAT